MPTVRQRISAEFTRILAAQNAKRRHAVSFPLLNINRTNYTVRILPGTSHKPHEVWCTRRFYDGDTGPLEEKGPHSEFHEPRLVVFENKAGLIMELIEELVAAIEADNPKTEQGEEVPKQSKTTVSNEETTPKDAKPEAAMPKTEANPEPEPKAKAKAKAMAMAAKPKTEPPMKEPDPEPTPEPVALPSGIAEAAVKHIPISRIDLKDKTFMFRADLKVGTLKDSIAAEGQQLPVVVRRIGTTQRFQLISGFRRVTALKELGADTVSAIIRTDLDDDEAAFRASVIENIQRQSYSDIDRAYVIMAYKARGYTTREVANVMGLRDRQVQNLKRLLDLPESVRAEIADTARKFDATHALTLARIADGDEDFDWAKWMELCHSKELSVSKLKAKAAKEKREKDGKAAFTSLFNKAATDLAAGVVRFLPGKVEVGKLSEGEKAALKTELEALLGLL